MSRNPIERVMALSVGLCVCVSLLFGQAPASEKTTPPASRQEKKQDKKPDEEKKAEKEAPPKKKMKKVQTLFGEVWEEDKDAADSTPAAPGAAPATEPTSQNAARPGAGTTAPAQTPVSPAPPGAQTPSGPSPTPATPSPPEKPVEKNIPQKAEEKGVPPTAEKKPEPAPAPQSTPPGAHAQPTAAAGAASQPQGPAAPSPASTKVSGASLVFNNADLIQVIRVITNLLKLNYILDPGVKGVVNITTMGDISNSDLMQIMQTLLRINGATAIQTGNIWQIVPLKNARQIPIALDRPGQKPLSPDDQLVTEIIPMQFVNASDMSKILKEFLSDAGSIVSHDRGNILIITEASRNMARLFDLMRIFDSEALESQRVRLFQIKNNSARSMIEELKNIFSAYSLSDKDSALRFIPIERLNSILVVAPNPKSFDSVEQWIEKLDQPSQVTGIRNYVYRLQYAKAAAIRNLLAELYGSVITRETPIILKEEAAAAGAAPSTAGLSPSTILAQASRQEKMQQQEREVYGFKGNIKVVADENNNMLIIQATPQDYDLLEQTLHQIDIMPRQVLIEAQIFRVDLLHDFSLGIEYFLQQRGTATNTRPLASFTGGSLTGSSIIFKEGARELFSRITATENRSRTKTLSSPSILATDNQEARIQVGVSIPTLSSSGFSRGGSDAIVNTISNVDTGIILSVTPRVNANGLVGMKITQEVSSPVAPPPGVSGISPSINRSTASTTFVVKDGETVAIAGLISEDKELARTRIPVLGDIPFLGALFGNTSYTNKRSELIIFITPHVIETLDDQKVATDALREEMKKLKKEIQAKKRTRQNVWEKVQPGPPTN